MLTAPIRLQNDFLGTRQSRAWSYQITRLQLVSTCTARMAKYSNTVIDDALRTATKEMGYPDLRPKQEEVVRHFMRGRDVFVSLPTGSGKSLCYSVLPRVFDQVRKIQTGSVAVVVSPLIALMKDQVWALTQSNVRAVCAASKGRCSSLYGDL